MKSNQLDWPEPQPKIVPQQDSPSAHTPRTRRYRPLRQLNEKEEKLLATLHAKPWIADCQPAPPEYVGSDALVNYLASYISGTAISDRRMIALDEHHVEFSIKDYRNKCKSTEKLSGAEFVQRYALHVLPSRMQRVRYAGMFRAEGLKERLEVCRAALGEYQKSRLDVGQAKQNATPPSPDPWREDEEDDDDDRAVDPGEANGMKCECGQMMESKERIDPAPTMTIIDFVKYTVSSTLPELLGVVLKRLMSDLQLPSTSRRLRRQLCIYGLEVNVLSVLLTDAMPVKEEENAPVQTHEHLSGIPPPCKTFIHDDAAVTEYA